MAISLQIDEELDEQIRRMAERDGRTLGEVVREAVLQYAQRLDAQLDFQREADASWEAYQRDGLHLTGDEVLAWLTKVGTDEETEIPECHT